MQDVYQCLTPNVSGKESAEEFREQEVIVEGSRKRK